MPEPFEALPLSAPLQQAVRDLGFTAMTPIQAAALPPLLAGRDVIGQARTGSGKTAAFGLPLLQALRLGTRRVQALVLCPTRELAVQVTADLRAFGKRLPGLRIVTVYGGQPGVFQARTLAEGAHVVVGTPGRTLDHLKRGALDLAETRMLVLDEADRMLELGFAAEMNEILAQLPTDRQTALFSATWPDGIAALSRTWQRDPLHVTIAEVGTELQAFAAAVAPAEKPAALHQLLAALQPASALVFCNLKRVVAESAEALTRAGFDAAALHGDLAQPDRDRVLAAFRNGSARVLVATDVAARGLDIAGLDLVVNADLPDRPEDYQHRVGRTGRAGRPGLAWTLATPTEVPRLAAIAAGSAAIHLAALPATPGPALTSAWATLRLSAGRSDKLRPGDLLGALTGDCGLTAADVGKIEIHERQTFVAVAKAAADPALRGLSTHGVKGRRVRAERAF